MKWKTYDEKTILQQDPPKTGWIATRFFAVARSFVRFIPVVVDTRFFKSRSLLHTLEKDKVMMVDENVKTAHRNKIAQQPVDLIVVVLV